MRSTVVPLALGLVVSLTACETSLGTRADTGPRRDAGLDAALPTLDAEPDAPGAAPDAAPPPDAFSAPDDAFVEPDAITICPPPGPMDCSPGPGTGEGDECTLPTSCFLRQVQSTIGAVVRDHPEWFDASAGPTHVLEVESYMNAVVDGLIAGGLCAIRDPNAGDEITVKWNNAAAENFDILTASEDVRSGSGIYTSTCAPAWW